MSKYMNVIVITGASSGIGMEFAMQMDNYFENVDEFWLVARSRDKLREVANVLQHKTRIFDMDVTHKNKLSRLVQELKASNAVVRMLVNCAGYGVMGDFAKLDRVQTLGMVRLNCEALTDVTYRLIPFMRPNSRIIELASSAAFMPQPEFAVYAASKAYVHSFSRAIGAELRKKGIYVTSVCPGPVNTPFFEIAEKGGKMLPVKKLTMVEADKVVAQALRDSYHKRPVSVCSLPIRAFHVLTKTVPHGILMGAITSMGNKTHVEKETIEKKEAPEEKGTSDEKGM